MAKGIGGVVITYEDYRLLPDDGKRHEVMEGVIGGTPAPNTRHQRIAANLHILLEAHVRKNRLGLVFIAPTDVILSDADVLQPDLLFVAQGRLAIIREEGVFGAPDLVVEITSPASAHRDRVEKRQAYARTGVSHFWLVEPDGRTVCEWVLEGGIYRERSVRKGTEAFKPALFPRFSIPLGEVWA